MTDRSPDQTPIYDELIILRGLPYDPPTAPADGPAPEAEEPSGGDDWITADEPCSGPSGPSESSPAFPAVAALVARLRAPRGRAGLPSLRLAGGPA